MKEEDKRNKQKTKAGPRIEKYKRVRIIDIQQIQESVKIAEIKRELFFANRKLNINKEMLRRLVDCVKMQQELIR